MNHRIDVDHINQTTLKFFSLLPIYFYAIFSQIESNRCNFLFGLPLFKGDNYFKKKSLFPFFQPLCRFYLFLSFFSYSFFILSISILLFSLFSLLSQFLLFFTILSFFSLSHFFSLVFIELFFVSNSSAKHCSTDGSKPHRQ